MLKIEAEALTPGQEVWVWSGQRGRSSYYSVSLTFPGLEQEEGRWMARVTSDKWLPGESTTYPLRQVEVR